MNVIADPHQTDLVDYLSSKPLLDLSRPEGSGTPRVSGTQYHRIREVMHARFPAVFTARKTPPVPLKIGIKRDILALDLGISTAQIKGFLYCWAQRREYQAVLVAGAKRYGLDGAQAGVVTKEQAQRALSNLEARSKQAQG